MSREKWFALCDLATEQNGMFTTRQALGLGYRNDSLTRFISQGRIIRERRNVYRINGAPPSRWVWVQSLWLALAPEADPTSLVVSHARAADLYDLGDINPEVTEFTHPTLGPKRTWEYRIHQGVVGAQDWWYVHGVPVTTPRRTVADLVSTGIDGDHLGAIIIDAVQKQGVLPAHLEHDLAPLAAEYGFVEPRDFIAYCVAESGVPTDSAYLTQICRQFQGRSLALAG